jgi:membrane protein DedA with SNARE-associated domain
MGSLHQANVFQKSDIVHGAELGLMIGGAAGLILGAIAVLAPPSGVQLQFVTILIAALAGAFFGAWVSSLVAASVPNSRLLEFAKDIEAGKILMIVDVPSRRVEEIQQLVERQHPEAGHGRIEATMPAFP